MTEEAENSPGSETPAETAAPAGGMDEATTDVAAGSSSATDAKEAPPSLLDVVKAVVEPKKEEPEASSAAAAEKKDAEPAKESSSELTEAEIAKLPFHQHPRFQELLTQRNALRGDLDKEAAKVKELEVPAQQWTMVRQFMADNHLSDEDMATGFRLMAMIRANPYEGRKAVADYLASVDRALGLTLPDDLQEAVDTGQITEEHAAELSRTRAEKAALTAQADAQRQVEADRSQRQAQEQTARLFADTTQKWETALRARDPDFEAKEDLIADRLRALMASEGHPRSTEELTALLERAHGDVTAHLRRIIPAPKAVSRPTSASAATVASPAPKTMREAIALAAGV